MNANVLCARPTVRNIIDVRNKNEIKGIGKINFQLRPILRHF